MHIVITDHDLSDINVSEFRCPACHSKGVLSKGHYKRDLIVFEDGKRKEIVVSIPRGRCPSCGISFSVMNKDFIPCGSYSLKFIEHVLERYQCRDVSVKEFCEIYQIAPSTLYGWIAAPPTFPPHNSEIDE